MNSSTGMRAHSTPLTCPPLLAALARSLYGVKRVSIGVVCPFVVEMRASHHLCSSIRCIFTSTHH